MLASRRQALAELHDLSLMLPTVVIIYVTYLSSGIELSKDARQQQSNSLAISFVIAGMHMQTDFFRHMVIRQVAFWTGAIMVSVKRIGMDEMTRASVGIIILLILFFETTFYLVYREKLILFQRFKQIKA